MSDEVKIIMGSEQARIELAFGITKEAFRAAADQLETAHTVLTELFLKRHGAKLESKKANAS